MDDIVLSEATSRCLDVLVEALDVLYECLAAEESIEDGGVKAAFSQLVRQACELAQPVEERTYRIVKTDTRS